MSADFTALNSWLVEYKNREEMITALTAWRENRGGGKVGMQSVINAIVNRVKKHHSSFYAECTKPWQFTSISDAADPQFGKYPITGDKTFALATSLAYMATGDYLPDLTNGSTVYYNPAGIAGNRYVNFPGLSEPVRFPTSWKPAALTYQTEISNHLFFTEL